MTPIKKYDLTPSEKETIISSTLGSEIKMGILGVLLNSINPMTYAEVHEKLEKLRIELPENYDFNQIMFNFGGYEMVIVHIPSNYFKETGYYSYELNRKNDLIAEILGFYSRPTRVTEKEISVAREKRTCIICKGKVERFLYLCPNCEILYCKKCADFISNSENACWICYTRFDLSRPIMNNIENEKEEGIEVEQNIEMDEDLEIEEDIGTEENRIK